MSRASLPPLPAPLRRLRAWVLRRVGGEGGFILLESIVAISIITVIMGAVGAEYVSGLVSTSHQRAVKSAVQLADTGMEQVRALHASDLLTGRDHDSVLAERNFLLGYPTVGNAVSGAATALAYDSTVSSGGATAAVPTCIVQSPGCAPTPAMIQKPGAMAFTVYKYLECASASDNTCLTTGAAPNYIRAIVAVLWTQRGCPSSQCAYTTSTLISADADPQFNINQPLPPAPQIATIATQGIEVGDAVSLQLLVKDNTGVAPFFWAEPATAPAGMSKLSTLGLVLSPGGLISGTVSAGAVSGTQTQVILTDSFGSRSDTATITWTVYPKLVFTAVANQNNLTTDTVNLSVTASGGKPSYTFSDPDNTLPAGLSISAAGKITGSPTSPGVSSVYLVVTDSTNPAHTTTSNTFTWTVSYPPVALGNPGTQNSTVGKLITPLTFNASSGAPGGYTWTTSGLPTNLTRSGNTVTGTPSVNGTYSVTVKVTDSAGSTATQNFTWTVFTAPTIASPGTQTSTLGGPINTALTYTCPNSPCTITLNNSPVGPSVSGGTISGTVGGTAQTYSTASVTITDAAGASVTSSTFTWTVNAAPVITSPDDQTTKRSTAVSLSMATFVTGGTSPYMYALTGSPLPAGLTLNTSTGLISGTTGAVNSKATNIKVRVSDARGVTAATAAFTWNVSNLSLAVSNYNQKRTKAVSIVLTSFTSGGTAPYTYTVLNLPPGLNLSGSTISGTPTTAGTWTATITATDSTGADATDTSRMVVS